MQTKELMVMTEKTKIVQNSLEQASRMILMLRENERFATVETKIHEIFTTF